jgi:hypothetical protein
VFIVFSLELILCNLALLIIKIRPHHRVYAYIVQLYIHDAHHS